MENLRSLLASKNKEDPIAFGHKYKRPNGAYFAGGSGYVMSRSAMIRFVTLGLPMKNTSCPATSSENEDWRMGECLESVGVTLGDDRDSEGRSRFFPLGVEGHITYADDPGVAPWFENYTYYPAKPGFQCCSPTGISTHYITGLDMYAFEYAIYHLRISGMDYPYSSSLE
ncbi:unnamed protein product [Darwinula stevensoni]|nr:unnamed protein product [Darwinula stevensoni]CAG0884454.1 unnamed protein product [Darwinula stevensoni]